MNLVDSKGKKYYGKFRTYCFINFAGIALMFTIAGISLFSYVFSSANESSIGLLVGAWICALVCAGICYLLWKPVAQKLPVSDRGPVFKIFCITGLFVFAKVLLACTVILIPLAMRIGGYDPYEARLITTGPNAGKVIAVRYIGNGQYEDVSGHVYHENV